MDTLINDIRYSFRSLIKAPAFTAVAVVTLALGIGANTAVFSVLYGTLLRQLPYPKPDQLVGFVTRGPTAANERYLSYRQYQFLDQYGTVFNGLAASAGVGFNLTTEGAAFRVSGLHVSHNYFDVLGVAPQLGRTFTADEDIPSGPRVAILAARVWRARFAGDRAVLGRAVNLDGQPYTIVGVMPDGFDSGRGTGVWTTLAQVGTTIGTGTNLEGVGRLRDGLTLSGARQRLAAVSATFQANYAKDWPKSLAAIDLESYRRLSTGSIETPVLLLGGAIALVLLIACANVANLLLSRAAVRSREISVRVAIGATRWRLLRQLITESVVLAVASGAASLILAWWGLEQMLTLVPRTLPSTVSITIDRTVLLFTGGLSVVTGVVFGMVPAWVTSRSGVAGALKDAGRGSTGGSVRTRLRDTLAIGEVAISLVLLTGAGLLLRTFAGLAHTDAGFDPGHIAEAQIWVTAPRYATTTAISNFYADLTSRLEHLPGVSAAAVVEAGLPLTRGGNEGVKLEGSANWISADYRTVTPGYFRTLGVPLLGGRLLDANDRDATQPVVVVNQAFAKRYFADQPAVGAALTGGDFGPRQVVGVVGDVRSEVTQAAVPTVYLASAQTPVGLTTAFNSWYPIHVLVRVTGDPHRVLDQLAQTIKAADPLVPIGDVRAMDDVLATTLATQRFTMSLLIVFATLACVLSAVGLYGVISYLVTQRTHEMGIRMALGARAGDVQRLVLRRGITLAAIGTALGLVGAIAATRVLASQLYHVVSATDPLTLGVAVAGLLLVAGLATYLPARRASRVDPIIALRHE